MTTAWRRQECGRWPSGWPASRTRPWQRRRRFSGSVGAARTARLLGLPALAVSLDHDPRQSSAEPAWDTAAELAAGILRVLLRERWPAVLLSLNVPDRTRFELGGLVATAPSTRSRLDACQVLSAGPGDFSVRFAPWTASHAEPGTDLWAVSTGLASLSVQPPLPNDDHAADLVALCETVSRELGLPQPVVQGGLVALPGGRLVSARAGRGRTRARMHNAP
jgi:Survival protein SurE